MRMFETGELVLFAAVVGELDLITSLHVVLAHAYSYISSAPILALYATAGAVAAKVVVVCALLIMFAIIKLRMWRSPRADKIIRTSLYAYIAFTFATNVILAFALETLSMPPIISQTPQ